MRKPLTVSGIFLIVLSGYAQTTLHGRVMSEKTKEPLPFVNIAILNTRHGTSSDIDGRFSLALPDGGAQVQFTYLGYEPLILRVTQTEPLLIVSLRERITELEAIVIRPGNNPALRIVRKATANKALHDPENLPSFSYNSYNKLYSTLGNRDTLSWTYKKKDSAAIRKFVDRNHLFMIESYTERKFLRPNFSKEVVLGNRMSGIKDPFFSFLATDLQPFSFYKDFIELFGNKFLSPLTSGSAEKYDFTVVDTVYRARDSVFVVTFEPLPGKSFQGLKGQLYISSDGFAIEHVLAELADDKALLLPRIQQKYEKREGHWFPVQLNTELRFSKYTIRGYGLRYASRSYLTNIQIGRDIKKKEFGLLNVEFDPMANRRQEEFWTTHRYDSLERRERNTYKLYDSLSGKLKPLNSMMKLMEGFVVKRFTLGKFYLPTEYLLKFNQYEKARLGVGFQTGERISKFASLEGYAGYGFKDNAFKYGGALQFTIDRAKDTYLKFSYRQDLQEPGKPSFMRSPGAFRAEENLRNWLAARMDSVEEYRSDFHFRPMRFSQINLYVLESRRKPTYQYTFLPDGDLTRAQRIFNITEFGIQGRFAFNESFTQIGRTKVITNLALPQINVSASHGYSGLTTGSYEFTRVEFKIDEQFTSKGFGKTTLQLASGYAWGQIPYPYLFNGKGTLNTMAFVEAFLVPNYFQTMGLYEFASDRYTYLFINHNFGRITGTKSRIFRPELSLAQNMGVGSLQNPSDHQGVAIKTMEKGYFESGLILQNLLRFNYVNIIYYGLGVGAFYRYGNYALPSTSDNLAWKVVISATF